MNNEVEKDEQQPEEIKVTGLYSVAQVAALLGCTRGNVHAKIRTGALVAERLGTFWYARGREVKRLLAERALR